MSRLTRRVETTLAIYRDLKSCKSPEVQAALDRAQQTMQLDPQLAAYLRHFKSPQAKTVVLAQGWLRRRKLDVDLIGKAPHWRSPRMILQRYLFKKGQYQRHIGILEKVYQQNPSMRQEVTEAWIREYLSS